MPRALVLTILVALGPAAIYMFVAMIVDEIKNTPLTRLHGIISASIGTFVLSWVFVAMIDVGEFENKGFMLWLCAVTMVMAPFLTWFGVRDYRRAIARFR